MHMETEAVEPVAMEMVAVKTESRETETMETAAMETKAMETETMATETMATETMETETLETKAKNGGLEEPVKDEENVVIGPLKLCTGQEKILVLLTCTTKQASATCQLSVHKCVTVPSLAARLGCLAPPYEIKKGPLIYDCTIKPSTAINLDRFDCNHGKPKLAVLFYQSEDDVGGAAHKEMVFKEHCRSNSGDDVARLDALLCQGPYRDMHCFDVDIAPHQCIPEGPARLVIFPTHISVVRRYKQEVPKDSDRRGGQIATIKREMRPLPMVVRLKALENFSPLQQGFRFEVSQQSYFFGCDEGGDDINNLVSSFRLNKRNSIVPKPTREMTKLPGSDPPPRKAQPAHHRPVRRLKSEQHLPRRAKPALQRQLSAPAIIFPFEDEEELSHSEDAPSPLDGTPPPVHKRSLPPIPCPNAPELPPRVSPDTSSESPPSINDAGTANLYINEWEARRCTEELHGGIKLNIGIFAAKPQLGQTWIVYVTIYKPGLSLKDVKENFPDKVDIVCPPRAFQVARHLSINAEVPEGWKTADVVKDIYMESLDDLGGQYIHDICIKHKDTEQKQFHGRIHVRQGLIDTLTLNIITNFSLYYERVGRRGADEPLYDLVPASGQLTGFLQQFSRRKEFCDQMDQINIFGNDYRLLGEKIGLDYQALLAIDSQCSRSAAGTSPTELVLREWERGGRSTVPFSQEALVTILHDMGRPDIIQDMGLQVPKLTDFRVYGTTANSIRVTWELDTQDVTDCTIELKPSGGDSWTTVDCVQNNGNDKTFQLENLQAETEYSIRIQPSFQRVQGEWTEIQVRTDAALEEELHEDEDGPPNDDCTDEVQQDRDEQSPPD